MKKKKNAPIKSTQSEIDVKSPRKRDKTWIPSTHSEHGRNSRLEQWLSSVDAGRGVTPSLSEPGQQNSNHFSSAHGQLGQGQLLLRNRVLMKSRSSPKIKFLLSLSRNAIFFELYPNKIRSELSVLHHRQKNYHRFVQVMRGIKNIHSSKFC